MLTKCHLEHFPLFPKAYILSRPPASCLQVKLLQTRSLLGPVWVCVSSPWVNKNESNVSCVASGLLDSEGQKCLRQEGWGLDISSPCSHSQCPFSISRSRVRQPGAWAWVFAQRACCRLGGLIQITSTKNKNKTNKYKQKNPHLNVRKHLHNEFSLLVFVVSAATLFVLDSWWFQRVLSKRKSSGEKV